MKESISYSFLLNIIILFVLVCFAIVTGVFSYYRAFRASTIISQAIEKYEGYNCASKLEIQQKLETISYNPPFQVSCKDDDTPCYSNGNYLIISYNLDGPKYNESSTTTYYDNLEDNMGSAVEYKLDTATKNYEVTSSTKNYQYGIYTYMYVDMPIISNLLKLKHYSRTDIIHEFRSLSYTPMDKTVYDERMLPEINGKKYYLGDFTQLSVIMLDNYASALTGGEEYFLNADSEGYEARERAKLDIDGDSLINSTDTSILYSSYKTLYDMFGKCENVQNYENY